MVNALLNPTSWPVRDLCPGSFLNTLNKQAQAQTHVSEKGNVSHCPLLTLRMHCFCSGTNWQADTSVCWWQQWKPQDSTTCLQQRRNVLFVLTSITLTCLFVENRKVLCITGLSYKTMGCFTKPTLLQPLLWKQRKNEGKNMCLCVCDRDTVGGRERRITHHKKCVSFVRRSCSKTYLCVCGCVSSRLHCECVRSAGMIERVSSPCQSCGYSPASGRGRGAKILHYGLIHHLWDSLAPISDPVHPSSL